MLPIERHAVPVLNLRGKDSVACLILLREFWPKLRIIWANTGDAFPETIAFMDKVRGVFGNRFIEAKADVETWRNANGWPADIVPISHTHFGGMFEHSLALREASHRPKIVPYPACCGDNFWKPMRKAALDIGATLIISGQKNSDRRKGPLKSGDVDDDGLEHWSPLQDWDDAKVYSYLGAYLPPWYQYAAFLDRLE